MPGLTKKDIEYWKQYYAKSHKVMEVEIDMLREQRLRVSLKKILKLSKRSGSFEAKLEKIEKVAEKALKI